MIKLYDLLNSKDITNVKLAIAMRNNFTSDEWWEALLKIYNNAERADFFINVEISTWYKVYFPPLLNTSKGEYYLYLNNFLIAIMGDDFKITQKKYRTKKRLKNILIRLESYLNSI